MRTFLASAALFFGIFINAQITETDSISATDTISSEEIQEVLIKSQRKKQFSDHAAYTFDKEALEKARHAKDLLITLPELKFDPISNTVKSIKGGEILFLINGIEATDNQIKSISPENVVKVDYYDIPPAKYATRADTVVNIITRNPETGYSFGAEESSAFSTGFLNASASADYTKGKNNFGMEYSINLRDYDNRISKKTYEYPLNGNQYTSEDTRKDHFGYTYQDILLRYTNAVPDKYGFQAKLSMEILTGFYQGIGGSIFTKNAVIENHGTVHNGSQGYSAPTLDLYYSKNLGQKDELSFNIIGSFYNTKNGQFDHEWNLADDADVFRNSMDLRAKQNGIVGEIAHSHNFEKGKWSSGYRISNTNISNDLSNLQGKSNYTVNYLTQYLYTEYSGKADKFSYRLGIGLTNIHNKSAETSTDDWSPTPKLVLGYALKDNQNLRFTSGYTSNSPWSEALSSNVIQVVPNIVERGNPFLKTQHIFRNNLIYSFNSKYFDLNATAFYNYVDKYFAQFYVLDNDFGGYALTYENGKYYTETGVQISGSAKPFENNLLVLKTWLAPVSMKLTANSGQKIRRDFIRNNFTISSEYKNFSIQYEFNIPVYAMNGTFLGTDENAGHIFAGYKIKNWKLTSGIYWLGMPSEYNKKTLPESLVNFTSQSIIHNNKNMFVLGLSYDFSTGKKNELNRKLNNSTAPAATF
ncbi:MAG: outer membrane beta-barrel family protein [Flavobacteriaceae bacterium]|jgi:hypothetical protein|nr:outer membrane beta-barrel family protein [Flavobacteriaceae bacterium]